MGPCFYVPAIIWRVDCFRLGNILNSRLFFSLLCVSMTCDLTELAVKGSLQKGLLLSGKNVIGQPRASPVFQDHEYETMFNTFQWKLKLNSLHTIIFPFCNARYFLETFYVCDNYFKQWSLHIWGWRWPFLVSGEPAVIRPSRKGETGFYRERRAGTAPDPRDRNRVSVRRVQSPGPSREPWLTAPSTAPRNFTGHCVAGSGEHSSGTCIWFSAFLGELWPSLNKAGPSIHKQMDAKYTVSQSYFWRKYIGKISVFSCLSIKRAFLIKCSLGFAF